MYRVGAVEKFIYKLRTEHPLVIPQLDPDRYNSKSGTIWLKQAQEVGLSLIAFGGSMTDYRSSQELLDIALKDFDFKIVLYLTSNSGLLKGKAGRTGLYWLQVPNSLNTFYGWDGIISNALNSNIENKEIEPIPTAYVFDDRGDSGTANWVTRSYPVPREKPKISLAIARAAQYLGVRFYIMAGGSGSKNIAPLSHVEELAKNTELFVIPTSGIITPEHSKDLFSAGADAIHVGNLLQRSGGFKTLNEMVKISKLYPGRNFL